ncbi:MAG TPA: sodium-translocating pyrophosphatase [bacterium]|nr:sodium-translocating pyrophosphatase [bacterium]HPP30244.1 sodium-translocating pyrophosphatase [bacterium]
MEGTGMQVFAFVSSLVAIAFTGLLVRKIMKKSEGTPEMIEIAQAVRVGARAYLMRQYKGVSIFFGIVFVILLILAGLGYTSIFVPFAFLAGGFFSALSGYIGMTIATNSSARTTFAAKNSLNEALKLAFSSGLVMGLIVVGLALLFISVGYSIVKLLHPDLNYIASTMVCFGMGASAQALFARVGGGIYTKGADVGADLIGKVEAGIPEDDPRNPAVIADNVGDNVGDIAGMGADLYESYVGSILATMALSVSAGLGYKGISLPLVIAALGIFASIIGSFFVSVKEEATQANLLMALRKGIYIAAGIIIVASYFAIVGILGPEYKRIFGSVICGVIAGLLIGFFTEYYTSDSYQPTRNVAKSALTGHATVIIEGIATGMYSTAAPVIVIVLATIGAYIFAGGLYQPGMGLYGIGLAGVGLLSTLGITLATDSYGPVADNAGGNAEMSHQPPFVRQRTDALDALGNTTAATGKGFAIGSAALTTLALIAAFKEQIVMLGGNVELSVMNVRLIAGFFIGAMYPMFFSSMALRAVGRTAQEIVEEVRRQFKEIAGLMEGKAKPDYAKAVDICTKSAQKEMLKPAIATIILPVAVGLLLGIEALMGLLIGAMAGGFVLAVMMANAGASWDNAKKYIEKGNFGGKGTDVHKASVTGDTVGDPFKDTAGPSLNILIKLMSIVAIVFASFILHTTIFK